MNSLERRGTLPELTCADIAELAGLYVLDALEPAEREQVRAHLATCPEAHAEIRDLGGVVPAMASMAEEVDSPPELKARVMAAIAADPRAVSTAVIAAPAFDRGVSAPRRPHFAERAATPAQATAWRPPVWATWGAAIAAVLILAVVGVWGLGLQSRAYEVARRDAVLSEAIAAFSQSGSSVALVRPSGAGATGGTGFAAVTAGGDTYLVMVGLPDAPQGKTYQAWFIRDNQPSSAGLMAVDQDGYAILRTGSAPAGVQVIALTVEPAAGSVQPTSDPFALGELRQT